MAGTPGGPTYPDDVTDVGSLESSDDSKTEAPTVLSGMNLPLLEQDQDLTGTIMDDSENVAAAPVSPSSPALKVEEENVAAAPASTSLKEGKKPTQSDAAAKWEKARRAKNLRESKRKKEKQAMKQELKAPEGRCRTQLTLRQMWLKKRASAMNRTVVPFIGMFNH